MAEEIRKALTNLLSSYDGLYGIVLTDRDGVTIVKAATDACPEQALRMSFLSIFSTSSEQGSKLGMGKNHRIISLYERYQIIQISKVPIVLTLIANSESNTGLLMSTIEKALDPLVAALSGGVAETVNISTGGGMGMD